MADLATGSGVIINDLSHQFPSASFDGFDISVDQFPEKKPDNWQFHVVDLKKPISEEFHGKFDVVFIRLVITFMESQKEWETIASNAHALLKPGGWVQWVETQISTCLPIVRQKLETTTEGLEKVMSMCVKGVGQRGAWDLRGIGPIFDSLGMVEVKQDAVSSDRLPETRAHSSIAPMLVGLAVGKRMGFSQEELDATEAQARKDIESGAYVRFTIHSTHGRKPIAAY